VNNLNYWFQHDTTTGVIYPYCQETAPACSEQIAVLGPWSRDNAPEVVVMAYNYPERYGAKDGQLVPKAYLTASAVNGPDGWEIAATVNNAEAALQELQLHVLGQAFTVPVTNGVAALTVAVHPAAASQRVDVQVQADGYAPVTVKIGGDGAGIALQAYTDDAGVVHVAPTRKDVLVGFYASHVQTATVIPDLSTETGLLMQAVFGLLLPAAAQSRLVLLTDDQKNAMDHIAANLLPCMTTTLDNAAPAPVDGADTPLDFRYQRLTTDRQTAAEAFRLYAHDVNTIPNLIG
jgi:hypothetical protein